MSLVGRGNGYGYSKPQVKYHQQNSECMTTVIKEISRMTVNQKPVGGGYGGGVGDLQKTKLCKEEVIEENGGGYYGGDAVQKQHESFEEKGSGYNGYHGGGAGAVQKHDYKQKLFEESANGYSGYHGGGALQKNDYQQEEVFGGACDGGYSSLNHAGAVVKKNGYQHGAYGEAGAGYASLHGADMQKNGYNEMYGKADAGGYGGHYDGGAKQTNSYKQQPAYGGAITGAVQHHTYHDAYGEADHAGYGGAYYGGGAMEKHGYGGAHAGYGGAYNQTAGYGYRQEDMYGSKIAGGYPPHHGSTYPYSKAHGINGSAAKTEFAGGHHHGTYESESDCEESDYESDCEETFHPHGGAAHGGGAHSYESYKRGEKHGGSSLGGMRRYESYERRENLGGGHRYESYQTTSHGGYTGGAGYGACAPRKNRFFF